MITIYNNYPISHKSYIHIGGIVLEYVECNEVRQSTEYLNNKNYICLGNTTKILFAFDRSELTYFKFTCKKVVFNEKSFFAYSGISLNYLNYLLMKREITGFEQLSTIPGCLGGSIVNNASFLEQCISDLLIRIFVFENGKCFFIDKEEIAFSYRKSGLKRNNLFIIGAEFKIKKDYIFNIKKRFEEAKKYRENYQEQSMMTLGSTFKNIGDIKIGQILDKLSYKGYIFSENCRISNKHANFILIKPYSNYQEIYNLIKFLKDLLYNYLQKEIEEEIQIIFGDGTRN